MADHSLNLLQTNQNVDSQYFRNANYLQTLTEGTFEEEEKSSEYNKDYNKGSDPHENLKTA